MEVFNTMDLISLISRADIIVKFVLGSLLFFSIMAWSIFFWKYFLFFYNEKESEKFYKKFIEDRDLDRSFKEAKSSKNVFIPFLYLAGFTELEQLHQNELETESLKNVERAMTNAREKAVQTLNRKLNFLATVASSAPFIGLFGTVWGIMNAFRGLATQKTATLNVVAPGIAEALIATAIGLFAAIPSVMAYNYLSGRLERISQRCDEFTYEFINIVYRLFIQPEAVKTDDGNKEVKK
jgi:biopolymer transport protein TolQ